MHVLSSQLKIELEVNFSQAKPLENTYTRVPVYSRARGSLIFYKILEATSATEQKHSHASSEIRLIYMVRYKVSENSFNTLMWAVPEIIRSDIFILQNLLPELRFGVIGERHGPVRARLQQTDSESSNGNKTLSGTCCPAGIR